MARTARRTQSSSCSLRSATAWAVGYAANASLAVSRFARCASRSRGNIDLRTFLGLAQANAGYEAIQVSVLLDADASTERLEDLHRSVVGTSPVGHTLERAVPVTFKLARPAN